VKATDNPVIMPKSTRFPPKPPEAKEVAMYIGTNTASNPYAISWKNVPKRHIHLQVVFGEIKTSLSELKKSIIFLIVLL
jgi:hypothetical protein